jgi:dihydroorotate dehydrogenase
VPGVVGVNVGKNKETTDAGADYVKGVARLAPLADYLVANVSSPNTPGLRALQGRDELTRLIEAIRAALPGKAPPLLLKIAPDLTDDDLADIGGVALDGALDGLIVSNTTIERPATLEGRHRTEIGGLSGRPLFALSTAVLGKVYRLTDGRLPLIGTGGIAGAADAYAKIRAGASLVQLYTALVYEGPGLVEKIKRELIELLRRDGFGHISDAVGADAAG